ncbi:hypothetical protein D3C87_1942760 [compost metagenome]
MTPVLNPDLNEIYPSFIFIIAVPLSIEALVENSILPETGSPTCVPCNGIPFEFVLSSHPNVPSDLATIFLVNSLFPCAFGM